MKSFKKALAASLALAMVVTAVPVASAEAATTAKLSTTSVTVAHGSAKDQYKRIAVTVPTTWKNAKISVSSSNKAVATVKASSVKSGKAAVKVTAVKKGTAKVTVKVTVGNKVKKTLYATAKVVNAGLSFTKAPTEVAVGSTTKLGVKVCPSTAKVTYTSSDNAVATVDSKGNVKALATGKVTITAKSDYGKTVSTTINVIEANGVTATLKNPVSTEYPDTVLVSNQAVVNVKVVNDGKPVAGETVIFTTAVEDGYTADYEIKGNSSAVTNADGIAAFVVGNRKNVKSYAKDEVASVKYTATVASTGAKIDGNLTFAAIVFGQVNNVNNDLAKTNDEGISPLVVSENDKNGGHYGDGVTATDGTQTLLDGNRGLDTEYVDSQQVSAQGGKDHQVQFNKFTPYIYIPATAGQTSSAKEFEQKLEKSSGKYHTYADDAEIIKLDVDPKELTYATLNFDKLQLSEYTQLTIETFKSEADAKAGTGPVAKTIFDSSKNLNRFSYQIPLSTNYNGALYIKLTLQSAGQVNADKNDGYTVKNITGVYKTQTTGAVASYPYKDAKVTWKTVEAPLSEIKTLTNDEINQIKAMSGIDFSNFASVTYQVPVFPYTGNAVITCKDANGTVVAYYLCATKNNGYNVNVLDTSAKYCYKASKEEAFNQVGTITTQDGKTVTVNSEKTGVTTLQGTLTDSNGNNIEGFDAANSKVYTSVQWSPLPNKGTVTASANDGFLALSGQKIEVVAQLTDKNGNAVSTQGVGINFYGNDAPITAVGKIGASKVSTVKLSNKTDVNGQAQLTLQAAEVATLVNVTAGSAVPGYNVVLKVADKTTSKADLYWIDADLAFYDKIDNKNNPVSTSTATPYVTTDRMDVMPTTGSNWEYGVYATGNTLVGGTFNGKKVDISNLKINLSKASSSVGTINTETGVNGMATASSTKTGDAYIIGKLNAASIANDVVFTVNGVEMKSAGTGSTNLDKQLTIHVKWNYNGRTADLIAPNGTKVSVADGSTKVYAKIADVNGNAVKDTNVTFAVDNGTIVGQNVVKTNNDGIAAVTVAPDATLTANGGNTIVTATVDGIAGQTYTKIINWVKVEDAHKDFELLADKTSVKDGKITLTFKDGVVASSVIANEFTVTFKATENADPKTYAVSEATVDGNVVTLTIKNGPTDISLDASFTVNVKPGSSASVEYLMTSEYGAAFDTNKVIYVPVNQTDTNKAVIK